MHALISMEGYWPSTTQEYNSLVSPIHSLTYAFTVNIDLQPEYIPT